MKRSQGILIVILLIIAVTIYFSLPKAENEAAYVASVLKEREEKDDSMRSLEESPFSDSLSTFSTLKYFDVDPAYRVRATLEPIQNKRVNILATSSGEQERYLDYAWASFSLGGKKNRLLILEVMDNDRRGELFLSFVDETSARETYGGGRYLEVSKVPGATTIVLDFNKAYNPFCAYSDRYTCPLPPKENLLGIAISAGEKSFHE